MIPANVSPSSRRTRRLLWVALLLLCLGLLAAASLFIGSAATRPDVVIEALENLVRHRFTLSQGNDVSDAVRTAEVIILEQRLPRTILAVLVGLALGCAGTLIQGHTRNPLADPGILGVSSGAALAVVIATFVLRVTAQWHYVLAAAIGALLGSVLVVAVNSIGPGGRANPLSLILAGAGLNALFGALIAFVILTDQASLDQLRLWNAGSVSGRGFGIIAAVAPLLVMGMVLAVSQGPILNVLATGQELASLLGARILAAQMIGVVAITLLAGGATAAAGPIGFVGLVVPHVARSLVGADYRWVVGVAALVGAMLVTAADIVGRVIAQPAELQVGIVLAGVGAPFFIYLVRRTTKVSSL